jgi:tryptophanyl-tRNA synthetase
MYCFIADWHALTTMAGSSDSIADQSREVALDYLSAGLDPSQVAIFRQSAVPQHAELAVLLGMLTPVSWLERVPTYKEKREHVERQEGGSDASVSFGLLGYPVLQAADILLYRAHVVPVGKDQEQHLELTRNIAQRFNNQVGEEYFVLPEPLFTETPKVMSPADPMKKMSKSAGEKHYIPVFSTPEKIKKQIRSAVTDTGDTPSGEMSQGLINLFELLKAANKMDQHHSLMSDYQSGVLKYVHLKDTVAEALTEISVAMVDRRQQLDENKEEVKEMIINSSADIRKVAQKTMNEVKSLAGLMNVKI